MSEPEFDLYRINIPPEVIGSLPAVFVHRYLLIPVEWSQRRVVVAMATCDQQTYGKLRFILNCEITVVLANPAAIQFALEKYYPRPWPPSPFGELLSADFPHDRT